MATGTVTPPPLHPDVPTAKQKKYDRQLRLWAASGQQALENAHVLLLNSNTGVVGVETLKNLVLPGMGTFTIVDNEPLGDEDLGVNFFVDESSSSKYRVEECCKLLLELNPEVQGYAVEKSIKEFVAEADWSQYSLVLVAAPLWPSNFTEILDKISAATWDLSIPLVFVHSVGFYAHFSLQLPPSFPIVDTHPDPTSTQDLRLLAPWDELIEHARSQTRNLDQLNDHDHGHVPYLLLLLHYLDRWKEEHEGKYPQNYKEKDALRSMVRASARTNNAEGGEENYDEAVGAVLKSLNPPSIPSGLKEIFAQPECQSPKKDSSSFWIIANAISIFVQTHDVLPLPGAIPDMKAQSKDYIALQHIYRAKAQSDLADVLASVRDLEKKLERTFKISEKEIESFCKGAAFVKLVHGRRLQASDGSYSFNDRAEWAARELEDETSLLPIYIALNALDDVVEEKELYGYGIDDDTPVADQIMGQAETTLNNLRRSHPELDQEAVSERIRKHAEEMQRSGPFELHNISSLTGGMVAQEIIKIITKQYVPVDNTCVIDGIQSKTAVYRL